MSTGNLGRSAPRIIAGLLTGFLALQVASPIQAQKAPTPTGGSGGGGSLMARFRSRPALPAEGEESLSIAFRNRSFGKVRSVLWDFGDGATSTENNPTHIFGVGVFDVSFTVFGPNGTSDTSLVVEGVSVESATAPPDGGGDGDGDGDGDGGTIPLEIPGPLSEMLVPLPENLSEFIKDEPSAILLGKALFWDIQMGSDGLTACASCHYHAGADHRFRNTLNPGSNGEFDMLPSGENAGPNYTLSAADFPFHKFLDADQGDLLLATTDDVRGSQGVTTKNFVAVDGSNPVDAAEEVADTTFTLDGLNTLRVTGRDAPTNIGAVFFDRLFQDGRANNTFNGQTIWGEQDDTDPFVLEMIMDNTLDGTLTETSISIENAALASQAVGPPLSGTEMSWEGRSWIDIGTKMVGRAPLASQFVDPTDSVLGSLANLSGTGLSGGLTYLDLIAPAIQDRWWASDEMTLEGLSQAEHNFALIFGLAVMMYETTLIPSETPFDAFAGGDMMALTDEERRGLDIFIGKGKCSNCHGTSFFAGAVSEDISSGEGSLERMSMAHAVTRISARASSHPVPGEFLFNINPLGRQVTIFDATMRRVLEATVPTGPYCQGTTHEVIVPWIANPMLFSDETDVQGGLQIAVDGCQVSILLEARWDESGPALPSGNLTVRWGTANFQLPSPQLSATAVYDNGFYNIGVSESSQDLGAGDSGPFGPLSLTLRSQLLGEDHGFSGAEPAGSVSTLERVAVNGSFKVPTLRNVELTGPYFHNGSVATLDQIVEFYARGTNKFHENEVDLAPDVGGFELLGADKTDLIAFLKSLTDHRVRSQSAPFDHPELPLKHGHPGSGALINDGTGNATVTLETISATGAGGGVDLQDFESLLAASATALQIGVADDDDDDGLISAQVALFLDLRPVDVVSFQLSSPDAGTIVHPMTVAFTPDNYRTPMIVTVMAPDGTLSTLLETTTASSGDLRFDGIDVPDVEVIF